MNKHKAIRFLMVSTFLLMQLLILTLIVKDNYENETFVAIAIILLLAFILFYGYKDIDLHHEEYAYEKLLVALWVPVGALACYFLNISLGLGGVLAAGIIGTIGSFIPNLHKNSNYLSQLPVPIYCGAFIGMSSIEVTPSLSFVVTAGIITCGILILSKNIFWGIGGKLGTIAFIGVTISSLIFWITQ